MLAHVTMQLGEGTDECVLTFQLPLAEGELVAYVLTRCEPAASKKASLRARFNEEAYRR